MLIHRCVRWSLIKVKHEINHVYSHLTPPNVMQVQRLVILLVMDYLIVRWQNLLCYNYRHCGIFLGSRLIDHSQKMTVAARAMAEKKTVGHRS